MKRLPDEVVHFFQNQGFVIVSTVGKDGLPHCSCKGLVKIKQSGQIYVVDLYRGRTYQNLKQNPAMSLTAIDEHKFIGYCLKGKAEILLQERLQPEIIKAWEDGITGRLTRRLLKNIRDEKGHPRHPEILLPKPEYMICLDVEEIVDLTPHQLK